MKELLKENLKNSYSPYSNVKVSAVVVTSSGKTFTGVNIENASFGGTVCAERVAILKAISEGYKDFKELHIMSNLGQKTMPCFICRQTIVEFFPLDAKVYIYDNEDYSLYTVKDICPYPFSKEDLK